MAERRGLEADHDAPLDRDLRLLRRIPPRRVKVDHPSQPPNSDCFKPPRNSRGTSVDIWTEGYDPLETIRRAESELPEGEEWGLVYFTVGDVLDLGLAVEPKPLPDNPQHALIVGNFNKTILRKLATKAADGWIQKPVPISSTRPGRNE